MATEREARIADAVLDLSHRAGEPDAPDLLGALAFHVHDLLTVQAAGVTQLDGQGRAGRTVASTRLCRDLLNMQLRMAEGPCWDSVYSQESLGPVRFGASDPRWPRFDRYAGSAGITAITAIPVRTQNAKAGVLMLMNTREPVLSSLEMRVARALADAATACVTQRHSMRDLRQTVEQLHGALHSRVVIEQEKGVLSERFGVSVGEAFSRLRAHARRRSLKMRDMASDIAAGGGPEELNPRR
ncbi:ANTAR domain-containing protein [Amycolatopsis alba]|uniref:ANTAR domain-containing protein n=1 Tax=Amycolatopsis alba TaxID=76020 RepID=UPI00039C0ECD|nr:ANTAR domain-containing protein [Amycolatopsis alba]